MKNAVVAATAIVVVAVMPAGAEARSDGLRPAETASAANEVHGLPHILNDQPWARGLPGQPGPLRRDDRQERRAEFVAACVRSARRRSSGGRLGAGAQRIIGHEATCCQVRVTILDVFLRVSVP